MNTHIEWQTKSMKELATINYGKSPSEILGEYGLYPVLGTGGVERLGSNYMYEGDSIILGRKGTIDRVFYTTGRFWTIDTAYYLSDFKSSFPRWLFYFLQTLDLRQMNEATGVPSLARETLYRIQVPTPPCSEQAKIAEILSTVDRAIEQTEGLIAKKQRIKTGLMQDLLTRGIDKQGNLRSESTHEFKDSPLGKIPVEWDCIAIGEIARIRSGTTPLRSNAAFWSEGTIPWVKTGEIDFSEILGAEEAVTAHALSKTSLHLEPPGTVLIAMYGQGGTRGRSAYLAIEATTNQACAAIFGSTEHVNQRYLFQYLISQYSNLRTIGHGSNQVNLSGRILAEFSIKLPPISEQNRLSECFVLIDAQIKQYHDECRKLIAIKTALMQDLLTGRKRVTPLLELATTP